MKKNKIILALALGMMIIPLFVINAVGTTTTTNTNANTQTQNITKDSTEQKAIQDAVNAKLKIEADAKKNIEIEKTLIEKKIAEMKDIVKKKLESKAQQKVRTILEKIYGNLNAQTIKIADVDKKILNKINNLEKEGRDVTEVKAQYQIAKTTFYKTEAEIVTTMMILTEQTSKETSKEAIREVVKIAEESIRTTAREYRKVLPLLAKVEGDNSIKN